MDIAAILPRISLKEYMMATSTLDPDNIPEPDRSLGRGHGTDALGPSDISDTGSDVQPGVHAVEEEILGLDRGTTEDPDSHNIEVDGDSDAVGTGERATAGRDSVEDAHDVNVDRIDYVNPGDETDDMTNDDLERITARPPQSERRSEQR
jgi:hypothetical protein